MDLQRDLVKEEGQIFFVDILRDRSVAVAEKIVPAFILCALMDNFAGAQEKLRNYKYLDVTVDLLRDWTPGALPPLSSPDLTLLEGCRLKGRWRAAWSTCGSSSAWAASGPTTPKSASSSSETSSRT